MDLGIAGRRAIVPAASGGLGFATAAALVEAGVRVAICSRDRERIDGAAARLGDLAVPLVADVSTETGAGAFVREATEVLGGVDILVTNGAGPPAGNFASTDLAAYRTAIELNCLTAIAMCSEAVPAMQAQQWGRVLAITSYGVRQPIATLILSNTARSGLTAFLKTLAREVAADGVTVNSLQPGLHDTDRIRNLHGGDVASMAAGVPAGVVGRPEDFGRIAAFLCSEHARYVTGVGLPVDGGAIAGLL
ncbi:MAG: SDR family oxidoreductase [Acidimicrobiia bacterium]